MKTFKEMFVVGFFETSFSIFGPPNVASPTLIYVAYKDVEYEDLVHKATRHLQQRKKNTTLES